MSETQVEQNSSRLRRKLKRSLLRKLLRETTSKPEIKRVLIYHTIRSIAERFFLAEFILRDKC